MSEQVKRYFADGTETGTAFWIVDATTKQAVGLLENTNRDGINLVIDALNRQATFDQAREALEHCRKVFQSMADRGAYPAELLPFSTNPLTPHAENPHYLGKQGFRFVVEALAAMEATR